MSLTEDNLRKHNMPPLSQPSPVARPPAEEIKWTKSWILAMLRALRRMGRDGEKLIECADVAIDCSNGREEIIYRGHEQHDPDDPIFWETLHDDLYSKYLPVNEAHNRARYGPPSAFFINWEEQAKQDELDDYIDSYDNKMERWFSELPVTINTPKRDRTQVDADSPGAPYTKYTKRRRNTRTRQETKKKARPPPGPESTSQNTSLAVAPIAPGRTRSRTKRRGRAPRCVSTNQLGMLGGSQAPGKAPSQRLPRRNHKYLNKNCAEPIQPVTFRRSRRLQQKDPEMDMMPY
ncbi:hypothetical protein J3459_011891 [Metarhizium acridum]|nr:hypothetical protein J3459_011891 [Metarhizium acridum]